MLTTSRTNWGDLEPNRRLEWLIHKEGHRQTSGWDSQLAIPNTGILYQEINGVWVVCFRKAPGNDSPLCCVQGHSVFPLTIVCSQGCGMSTLWLFCCSVLFSQGCRWGQSLPGYPKTDIPCWGGDPTSRATFLVSLYDTWYFHDTMYSIHVLVRVLLKNETNRGKRDWRERYERANVVNASEAGMSQVCLRSAVWNFRKELLLMSGTQIPQVRNWGRVSPVYSWWKEIPPILGNCSLYS